MTESAYQRRRKVIVEHIIAGFDNAHEAVVFGNTIEYSVTEKTGQLKFRSYLGSPDSIIAITGEYLGKTTLKTEFLDVGDQAPFINERIKSLVDAHNTHNRADVKIQKQITRGKPQPQSISIEEVARSTFLGSIGG